MTDRRSPDALSWLITPDTIFQNERRFHELDGDTWIIERQQPDGTWEPYHLGDYPLRLTCERDPGIDGIDGAP